MDIVNWLVFGAVAVYADRRFGKAKTRESSAQTPEDLNSARAAYEQALTLVREKKYRAAEREYTRALSLRCQLDFQLLLLAGRAFVRSELKNYDGAIKDYERALVTYPPKMHLKILTSLVICYRLKKDYRGALKAADQALKIDSKRPELHVYRAVILTNLERLDAAIESCTEALNLDAEDGLMYVLRGRLHEKKNDAAAAEANFEQARKLGRPISALSAFLSV